MIWYGIVAVYFFIAGFFCMLALHDDEHEKGAEVITVNDWVQVLLALVWPITICVATAVHGIKDRKDRR